MADFGSPVEDVAGRACEVLIVGAGPTGLCLALALRRLGVECMVVDAGEGPRVEPRAAVVWPREAELLAAIGLGDLRFSGVASAFERPLVIEQHVLQQLLEAELRDAGAAVHWRARLSHFVQAVDGVSASLVWPDGGTAVVRAAWLVGCDGAHSLVRKQLAIPFVGRTAPNLEVVQAKADVDWPHDPAGGALFLAAGRTLGAFPMPDGKRRFYCFKTIEEPQRTSAPTLEEMQTLVGRMLGQDRLELRNAEWLSRARFQERIAERLRVGRVLLAGDAAHVWPAVGGHGMAVAILGACNLAWRLAAVAQSHGPVELLDAYGQEQRAQAATMIRKMRMDLFERPLPGAAVAGMAIVLPAILKSGRIQRWIERSLLSDISLHHRASPMSKTEAGGRPLAGDRLPDTAVIVNGRRRRLHELLSIGRWTLLAPTSADLDRAAPIVTGRGLIEMIRATPADTVAAAELKGSRLLLVRPDGYVGFTARPDDLGALIAYLDRWLPAGDGYSREARVSWPVMNSSSAGTPASV